MRCCNIQNFQLSFIIMTFCIITMWFRFVNFPMHLFVDQFDFVNKVKSFYAAIWVLWAASQFLMEVATISVSLYLFFSNLINYHTIYFSPFLALEHFACWCGQLVHSSLYCSRIFLLLSWLCHIHLILFSSVLDPHIFSFNFCKWQSEILCDWLSQDKIQICLFCWKFSLTLCQPIILLVHMATNCACSCTQGLVCFKTLLMHLI